MTTTDESMQIAEDLMRSERLRLRPVEEDELKLLDRWWNNPATISLQSAGLLPRPAGDRVEQMRGWHANKDTTSGIGFGVERIEGGEFLGSVVLFNLGGSTPSPTFAIQLRPDLSGRGYGTEATRLFVNYAFTTLPIHRIELQAYSYNTRAIRCYRSAGFVQEGVRRECVFWNGAWHDDVMMAMLRSEWQEAKTGSPARDVLP